MGILSLDVGGSYIKSAVVSPEGKISCRYKVATPSKYDDFLKSVVDIRDKLTEPVDGVAVAIPGGYDFINDEVFAPNLLSLNGKHIKTDIKSLLGLKTIVENDANLAALGEYIFAEKKSVRDMIFVTLGTGAGGGMILGGKLLPAERVTSFEIGHICVAPGGRPCGCGRQGCMDEYCTSSGLLAEYRESGGAEKDITPFELGFLAANGDEFAKKAFKSYARYLACGLVNVANLLCPEKIKLGGGLSELAKYYMDDCSYYFQNELFPLYRGRITLEVAQLKNDAGILGGGAYFYDL